MKHSIRYIQINYKSNGAGKSIFMLRGMEAREYSYSAKRFQNILNAKYRKFKTIYKDDAIAFERVYKG